MTVALVVLLGGVALSIDVGYLYVVRGQLQNAVDAAALAGAQGLLAQPGDYSADGQAMRLAIEYASRNWADGRPVNLAPSEISFPRPDTIKVDITRSVNTFFAVVLGLRHVNIRVMAAALAAPVSGASGGWRPFSPPDQFGHGGICVTPADDDHGPFNPNPHTWNNITASDYYKSPYDPDFEGQDVSFYSDCSPGSPTGFIAPRDVDGRLVELKTDHPNSPGNFYAVALGGRGASDYRDNIAYGWEGTVSVGDILTTEPGNMVGPTQQGVNALIAQDPNARMVRDSNGHWIVTSDRYAINESPRIVPIAFFDPTDPPTHGRTTFRVASIGAFFIESSDGRSVWGRFIYRKIAGATNVERSPSHPSRNPAGAAGRLLGTVQLVNPNQ